MLALFVQVSLAQSEFLRWARLSGIQRSGLAPPGGAKGKRLIYTDGDPEKARAREGLFSPRGGCQTDRCCAVGNAHDCCRKRPGKFDLIFNDVEQAPIS